MTVTVVTGSGGLVGSASVRSFASESDRVIGIDNDMRSVFFGADASTQWSVADLERTVSAYRHEHVDIRDQDAIARIFRSHGRSIERIIHTAAQPSHDWAARDPRTDFSVNAAGTLNLLEAMRTYCPEAVFVFCSTNKVYGDRPNALPLVELETRWELDPAHEWAGRGIPEEMSVDASLHSLFGASKLAADVLVQEYGRYFSLRTVAFRGGCLTGPGHSGTELHGFLAYLMKCTVTGTPYRVYGYGGKQVRDNIHADDLTAAFRAFCQDPRAGEVYNIGGGIDVNCSMLEAIDLCQEIAGRELDWSYVDTNRTGDHIWYVSDLTKFRSHHPSWRLRHGLREILEQIWQAGTERWTTPG